MKAVIFKGVGNIALEEVADPIIKDPTDVIVRITVSAICGTDLHLVRGTVPGMVGSKLLDTGTILGHEAVGVVEQVGSRVKDFKVGQRVIVPSTIACGQCVYCQEKIFSQCDNANPLGAQAGTAFYGGPVTSGAFNGMQAEKVRVPFADTSLIKIPDQLEDEQVILLSDILPTSYMAVEMLDCKPDDVVAVFGCGPVGQLAIACLKIKGVQAIFAIDRVPERLKMAQDQGAHTINFDDVDPADELKKLTNGRGPTKVLDAVGIDAQQPQTLFNIHLLQKAEFKRELQKIAPVTNAHDGNWTPGDGPSQVLRWAVKAVAKAGTISIIGVYSPLLDSFPIGEAMNKNLIVRMGNCNHRAYFPLLLDWVRNGTIDLVPFITHQVPLAEVIEAYKHFDKREDGYIKVMLVV